MSKQVYICGCAYNCASYIPRVFDNIIKIGGQFDEYRVIVAYDHSTDKTLRYLVEQKKRLLNKGVELIILINNNPRSTIRTENISNARNSILDKIGEMNASLNWPYFAMIDLDNVSIGDLDISVLQRSLNRDDWDAISFNRRDYYDIWALSYGPYIYNGWSWSTGRAAIIDIYNKITNLLNSMDSDALLPCYSAFNGFGLYRCEKCLTSRYDWRTRTFNKDIMNQNGNHLNASPLNRPDDCEHRNFHLDAIRKAGARIRISPECLFTSPIKLFNT